MNKLTRNELYNTIIQEYTGLSDYDLNLILDIIEKLDFTNSQLKDKDYLMNQVDNILEY